MAKDADVFKEVERPADPPANHPLLEVISQCIRPEDPPLSPALQQLSKPVIPGADEDE